MLNSTEADTAKRQPASGQRACYSLPLHSAPAKGLLLHFFTNMAIVGDVRHELAKVGFGRIHHRILFLAAYAPGLSVSELLEALRVSHQNVRLPMKHLLDKNFLRVEIDASDRRQKRLFVTADGGQLIESLLHRQLQRIGKAFAAVPEEDVEAFFRVHELMIDQTDSWMLKRIGST